MTEEAGSARGIAVLVAAAAALTWLLTRPSLADADLALVATTVTLGVLLTVRLTGGYRGVVSTFSAFALGWLLVFGIAPVYRDMSSEPPGTFGLAALDYRADRWVLVVGALGILAGWLLFRLSHRGSVTEDELPAGVPDPLALVLYHQLLAGAVAVTVVLFGLHVRNLGGLGTVLAGRTRDTATAASSEYLASAPSLVTAVLMAGIALGVVRPTRSGRLLVVAATVLPFAAFLVIGNRRFLIPTLLLPLLTKLAVEGQAGLRRNRRALLLAGAFGIVLIALVPLVRSAGGRIANDGYQGALASMLSAPGDTVHRILTGPDTEAADFLSFQIERVEQSVGYDHGLGIVRDAVHAPFPSALVGTKPLEEKDRLLVRLYGEPCTASGGRCPDYGLAGSLYRVGGGLAVFTLLLAASVALLALDDRHHRRPGRITALALAVGIVFAPIIVRKGLVMPAIWPLYYFLPAALAVHLLARRSSRPRPVPPPPVRIRRREATP